jgi:hypothetical protein
MMLWAFPAAVDHVDMRGPCAAGGLVDQVVEAGKKV